ncbi:MAG: alpha/beta hydrolase [Chitinophagaceae bacterium]|nr:alpha/beta hydrolase [Chitinophagaceae bacterium]
MKPIILLFTLVIIVSSCQKSSTGGGSVPVAASTLLNYSYGADPLQKMDIYLPEGRSTATTKLLIMVHGGAWTQGDKSEFTPYVDTLKRRLPGYAIININYRLATGTINFFPTQEQDMKAAVDLIYSKRAEWLISDKFVLLGGSAGGHLVALQAYKYSSPSIKAVIDYFGPTELVDMYNNPPTPLIPILLTQILGGTPATKASLYQSSSPLNFVTAQSAPTLIFHGGTDIVVSPSQSVLLKTKLTTMGVVNQYYFYPTEPHGFTAATMTDTFDKIGTFLTAYVN